MKRPKHSKEPAFQLAWCALHLVGAAMHFGSFLYHLRRLRKEADPE